MVGHPPQTTPQNDHFYVRHKTPWLLGTSILGNPHIEFQGGGSTPRPHSIETRRSPSPEIENGVDQGDHLLTAGSGRSWKKYVKVVYLEPKWPLVLWGWPSKIEVIFLIPGFLANFFFHPEMSRLSL